MVYWLKFHCLLQSDQLRPRGPGYIHRVETLVGLCRLPGGRSVASDVMNVNGMGFARQVLRERDFTLSKLTEVIETRLGLSGFKNMTVITGALEDVLTTLSEPLTVINTRISADLSESCLVYLKGALEVPRLYRRTNKGVPTKASAYVENSLKPLLQLQDEYGNTLKQATIEQWLKGALSESMNKYYEIVSDVLSSVKKMEESLKRLKQARKSAASSNSTNGGVSDDNKIRLQLTLDVEHFVHQVQKFCLCAEDASFSALTELAQAAKDQIRMD